MKLLEQPGESLIVDTGPAGRLVRAAIPLAVLGVGLSALVAWAGWRAHLVGKAVGIGLFGLINLAIVTLTVLWCARKLRAQSREVLRMRREVEQHGLHDPLTGLTNRGFFMDQLTRRAALAERRSLATFAVFCLDIDGFRRLGQGVDRTLADRVLVKIGDVLRNCVRSSDLVARLEGDSFAILIEELAEPRDVVVLAERIQAAVPDAVARMRPDLKVSVNIGIAFKAPQHHQADEIMHEADAALRLAKAAGPGRYELTGPGTG